MQELKANTQVKVKLGPAVDKTDGLTPETTLDVATADEAELFKHDSAAVTDISGATWAAIANADGWYNLTLTTSLTDTEGLLDVIIQDDSLCLPIHARFMVLAEAAWDSKYAAKDTGFMDVNVKAISDDTTAAENLELFTEVLENGTGLIDAGTFKADAFAAGTFATGCLTADAFAADAIVAATLATGAFTADAFAADAIVAATLATGALTADAFAANALVAATFAADCITAAKIADDAISSEHLNTGCLTADAFAADAIVAATLATGCLTADAFAADAIVAATLATDAIVADALAADAVAEIITALKASTGDWSAGGTITYAEGFKVLLAKAAGDVTDGDSSDYNYGDIDDGSEVFCQTIAASTPYRNITVA